MELIVYLLDLLSAYHAERRRKRAEWEWRVGYLHAMDRRLFKDTPPMLTASEYADYKATSAAFGSGEYQGSKAPMIGNGLTPEAEQVRRLVIHEAALGELR